MELRPISFQSNMAHLSFSQYYKSFMDSECKSVINRAASSRREHFQTILGFIESLENDFTGPPYWLCTSHYDITFYALDYKDYSDTPEDGSAVKLTVRGRQDESDTWQLVLTDRTSLTIGVYEVREATVAAAKFLIESTPSCL